MNLYHGSLVVVEKPQILPRENGKTCDFGIGFYTTTNFEQAKRWVTTKITQSKGLKDFGFVSTFEVSDNLLSGLFSIEATLRELKTYKLADQILFHTEKALTVLKYITSEKVV